VTRMRWVSPIRGFWSIADEYGLMVRKNHPSIAIYIPKFSFFAKIYKSFGCNRRC